MKKVVSIVLLIILLSIGMMIFTGCTLTVETSDNSVSASVDGDTTEKVDGILDWIKERLNRVFDFKVNTEVNSNSVKVTTSSTEKA